MKCILGIGNPGSRYQLTRHNIGFYLLDDLSSKLNVEFRPSKSEYYFAEGELDRNPFVLIKPTTFVNRTGLAVKHCLDHYNISISELLVLVDDANLEFAEIRLRESGGDGGHNGLLSIIGSLGSADFPRLRFGIGNNFPEGSLSDYVLSEFTVQEYKVINSLLDLTTLLVKSFIIDGYNFMLSQYSRKKNSEFRENRSNGIND